MQGKRACKSNLEEALLVGGAGRVLCEFLWEHGRESCWGSQLKVVKPLMCVSTFPQRTLPWTHSSLASCPQQPAARLLGMQRFLPMGIEVPPHFPGPASSLTRHFPESQRVFTGSLPGPSLIPAVGQGSLQLGGKVTQV